ncbi:MAG: class I SAM-dependent methyltransferase, partial [Actinomycetota bacterium]|nr:class I SAM-dependent methyltransferase [Actinomycetota bacterium]
MGSFERYNFPFTWQSGAGQAVRLIDDLQLQPGLVVDLGCGFGPVAEELERRGFTYVGCDVEKTGLEDIRARGFEAHEVDLQVTDELLERIAQIVGDRSVSAFLLLDVLGQLIDPTAVLDVVWQACQLASGAAVVLSVPNVSHADLAAKLVFGRFDYTDTGLLDERNVSLFDPRRLEQLTRDAGFREVARRDFELPLSDQRFPSTHPALSEVTPVGQHLRHLRNVADPFGSVLELVRGYLTVQRAERPTVDPFATEAADAPTKPRFLTVVMRTQLRRPDNLREALTCLAAQIDDDFDVSLMVHHQDPTVAEQATAIVNEFHETFAGRVSVIPVLSGGRSRPLNEALDRLAA